MGPNALPFNPNIPARDPLLGVVINERYYIVRVLGEGGMGVVYEAQQIALRRRIAIKCLHGAFSRKAEVVARFQQEALATTSVRNPHVVEIIDLGRLPDGALFIAMEFLEGQELSRLLRDSLLPMGRIVRIAVQLCDALIDVHAKGIVHRDLKPDNIFLTRSGTQEDFVKILDFGISKIQRPDGTMTPQLTNDRAMLGTPSYMSPEQFGSAHIADHRADIYAVGGILYRALAGRTPFNDTDFGALVMELMGKAPPDLAVLRPDLPPALVAVIHKCLAKSPEDRPQSAFDLRAALVPFAAHGPVEHQAERPPPSSLSGVTPFTPSPLGQPTPAAPTPTATPAAAIVKAPTNNGVIVLVAVLTTVVVLGAAGFAAVALQKTQAPGISLTPHTEAVAVQRSARPDASTPPTQVAALPPPAARQPPVQTPPVQTPPVQTPPAQTPVITGHQRSHHTSNRALNPAGQPSWNPQSYSQPSAPQQQQQQGAGLVHSNPGSPF